MKKLLGRRRWLIIGVLTLPVAVTSGLIADYWNNFIRVVVSDRRSVALPDGGVITYVNQSPRSRLMGPADTKKLLIWVKPDGEVRECPISDMGGGYRDLELRIRADGKAIWLILRDWNKIKASIDLSRGRCYGEDGIVYDRDGLQNESTQSGFPQWAQSKGGHLLGLKQFWW